MGRLPNEHLDASCMGLILQKDKQVSKVAEKAVGGGRFLK